MTSPTGEPEGSPSKKKTGLALHKADHDPRAGALVALAAVLFDGADSQAAIDGVLSRSAMIPTDKRLCTELVYGTLRHYSRLLWFASRCLEKPQKLPQEMLLTLVMALYEMTFLRIPHHASVGWAVSHVRNRFGQGLSRVANGTLRTLQRRLRDFHTLEFYQNTFPDEAEALAHRFAMPTWVVALWQRSYGEKATLQLLAASLDSAPSGLRLNSQAPGWQEARAELLATEFAPKKHAKHLARFAAETQALARGEAPAAPGTEPALPEEAPGTAAPAAAPTLETTPQVLEVGPCGLAFTGTLPWLGRDLMRRGGASGQSMASYSAITAFAPATWPQPLWDCCAGRGGKTLALLEMGVPVALASDVSAQRLSALSEEYQRLHLTTPPCPALVLASAATLFSPTGNEHAPQPAHAQDTPAHPHESGADARILCDIHGAPLPELPRHFGTILIDAPCSGLGTLARHPEIKYRRTQNDVADLVATQRAILEAALEQLAPGGSLIYLTCTLNPAENEEQVAAFLAAHPRLIEVESFTTPPDSPFKEFFYGAHLRDQG